MVGKLTSKIFFFPSKQQLFLPPHPGMTRWPAAAPGSSVSALTTSLLLSSHLSGRGKQSGGSPEEACRGRRHKYPANPNFQSLASLVGTQSTVPSMEVGQGDEENSPTLCISHAPPVLLSLPHHPQFTLFRVPAGLPPLPLAHIFTALLWQGVGGHRQERREDESIHPRAGQE